MMEAELTARQAAFCEAFVLGGSAAAAARAAGYGATGARTQAWRLLQQPAVRRRLQELRYSAQASETAFAARLMARAERLWDAAQAEDNHGLALRVMQMQFRIAGRYGAPPTSLVMGDEATLNDLTLTALVAETRRIELPAGVDIGPDVRAAAMTRPGGRVPHPGLPPRGKGPSRAGHEGFSLVPSPLGEGQGGGRTRQGASGRNPRHPMRIQDRPSPNHEPRPADAPVDILLLHYTGMGSEAAALARLCDPAAGVSAHYLICERGRVWQLVDEAARAWHAGAGRWGDADDVNSRSIGIELANRGDHPYPAPQMAALESLMHGIMRRWPVPPARVIAHSDMAPGRKTDPGPRFDWRGLARAGLSVWPDAAGDAAADRRAFLRDAARFGYPAGDVPFATLLAAVRLRFRPWATGPLDGVDCARMAGLAARFPVDRAAPNA